MNDGIDHRIDDVVATRLLRIRLEIEELGGVRFAVHLGDLRAKTLEIFPRVEFAEKINEAKIVVVANLHARNAVKLRQAFDNHVTSCGPISHC